MEAAMIWKRCAAACIFRTPDGKEAPKLPPPRPKEGTRDADRAKPTQLVFDAIPARTKPCPNKESCRCYILVQRIVDKGRDKNKVETEAYYPGNGDHEGALTQADVNLFEKRAKEQGGHWRYEYVAACLEVEADAQTGEVHPK
jgi:hypothetical protein